MRVSCMGEYLRIDFLIARYKYECPEYFLQEVEKRLKTGRFCPPYIPLTFNGLYSHTDCGSEWLFMLKQHAFDLVISDLKMPGIQNTIGIP